MSSEASEARIGNDIINNRMGVCVITEHRHTRPSPSRVLSTSTVNQSVILESRNYPGIHKFYTFKGVLGHGQFGTVREAFFRQKAASYPVAIKSILKTKITKEVHLLKRELDIMRLVDHPNVIKYYETYEDAKYLHLVMELCTGGDLFEHLLQCRTFSEEQVAIYMRKLLMAVNHLHSLNICHRDLKPENFLFVSSDPAAELKIIDFGMSNKFGQELCEMNSMVGTPYYLAPEVLSGRYGKECDVWSLGVVMYLLLSGKQPFSGHDLKEVFRKIVTEDYDCTGPEWLSISPQAKNLITRMIKAKPYQRITIEEAMCHPWFTEVTHMRNGPIPPRVLKSLRLYKAPSKLQQEAMKVILQYFGAEDINVLKDAFLTLDREKTGFITAGDLEVGMKQAGYDLASEDIRRISYLGIVASVDYLHLGMIKYSDFLLATIDRRKYLDEEMLYLAFTRFDTDHDGFITFEDLKQSLLRLNAELAEQELTAMIEECDRNSDKKIDFEEFKARMELLSTGVSKPVSRQLSKQRTLTLLAGGYS